MSKQLFLLRQEKHELGLKLQAKVDLERSLSAELDSLRDSLKANEEKRGEMKVRGNMHGGILFNIFFSKLVLFLQISLEEWSLNVVKPFFY